MHPIEGTWRELLDREAHPATLAELEAHLRDCSECQATVATLRAQQEDVSGLLEQLGGPAPARSAGELLARASRRSSRERMLAAATIALCLATAAGATVRAGLLDRANLFLHTRPSPTSTQTPAAPTGAGVPTSSGVELEPSGRLEVAFEEWQGRGEIVIVLSSGSKVSISASSPLDYSVRRGHVAVANKGGSASYRISLPAGITEVSIRVAGEEVFSKHGSTIQTQAKADASGSYHLPF